MRQPKLTERARASTERKPSPPKKDALSKEYPINDIGPKKTSNEIFRTPGWLRDLKKVAYQKPRLKKMTA